MAFDLLGLLTGGAKMIYDFQNCFGKQFGGYIASVIELKWEQDLESPPFAAHTWFSLLRRMGCPRQQELQVRLLEVYVHPTAAHDRKTGQAKMPARVFQFHDREI